MIALAPFPARLAAGTLHYRPDEYAFSTEPNPGSFTSLLVNDVHIEVDADGRAMCVWGLCPYPSWIARTLTHPVAVDSGLRATGAELEPGVGIRLNPGHRWPVFVDRARVLLCIGEPECSDYDSYRFAPGAVAVLREGELVALWLTPEHVPA